MKILINKVTEINIPKTETEEERKMNYADLIKVVCNSQIQGGYSIADIKARIAITGACDKVKAGKEISFENADATYLKEAVKSQKWGMAHQAIVDFVDDIDKMADKK